MPRRPKSCSAMTDLNRPVLNVRDQLLGAICTRPRMPRDEASLGVAQRA